MRILYHHRTASKDGQDVHIEEMIAAMRRQGHEVMMVAPRAAATAEFGYEGGMVARIKRLLPGALYELLELAYSLVAYRRLRQAYRRFQPDIVYERYALYYLAGRWLKMRTGLPYILEVNAPLARERAAHDGLKLQALARWCERAVWRGADMTAPVTDVLADFLRRAGVAEERITVIPNGINPARFPRGLDGSEVRRKLGLGDRIVLGFTGFIRDWHGLPHVIDAMAAMPNRDRLHLLVIGDGPARATLIEHAERSGMAAQLSCLGLVGRDQIAPYIAAFDIALQPQVVEYASPLKLFEYMGLGRAIIAPDQPNIREILSHEGNALLFQPGDMADFRQQIMLLCGDPDLRHRLGEAAADTISLKGLTWDNNVRRALGALSTPTLATNLAEQE